MEYQRTLYLFCVHGKRTSPTRSRTRCAKRPPAPGPAAARGLHGNYYRQQRFLLPSTVRLERLLIARARARPRRVRRAGRAYEPSHRPTLPFWALLASNSHKLGVVVAAFVPVAGASFWGGLGIGWFLVYDLALNLVLAALIAAQPRVDDPLAAELAAGDDGRR